MASPKDSLISFPCDFLIKIIGKNTPQLESDINRVLKKHALSKPPSLNQKISKEGNYQSFSVNVYVNNQEELDAIYVELTKLPDTTMVL